MTRLTLVLVTLLIATAASAQNAWIQIDTPESTPKPMVLKRGSATDLCNADDPLTPTDCFTWISTSPIEYTRMHAIVDQRVLYEQWTVYDKLSNGDWVCSLIDCLAYVGRTNGTRRVKYLAAPGFPHLVHFEILTGSLETAGFFLIYNEQRPGCAEVLDVQFGPPLINEAGVPPCAGGGPVWVIERAAPNQPEFRINGYQAHTALWVTQ